MANVLYSEPNYEEPEDYFESDFWLCTICETAVELDEEVCPECGYIMTGDE